MKPLKGHLEKTVLALHVDCCFMVYMGDSATRCVVVGEDFDSKSVMSSVVPLRGASHEYPERTIIPFVEELGLEGHDLVLRSDQESQRFSMSSRPWIFSIKRRGKEMGANSGGTDQSARLGVTVERLTEEIARRDEGNRVRRARQGKLEFYEKGSEATYRGSPDHGGCGRCRMSSGTTSRRNCRRVTRHC